MAALAAAFLIVGFVAAGFYFQHRLSRGRMWSPLWAAFSFTAAATVLAVRVGAASWSGEVTLSDVVLLMALAAVAIIAWRFAIRRLPGL